MLMGAPALSSSRGRGGEAAGAEAASHWLAAASAAPPSQSVAVDQGIRGGSGRCIRRVSTGPTSPSLRGRGPSVQCCMPSRPTRHHWECSGAVKMREDEDNTKHVKQHK